ncbi:MAG: DUF2194 domain-containing protein [Suipraeoptans sp.]
MLSTKKLLMVLAPFAIISIIFAVYNRNEQKVKDIEVEENRESNEALSEGSVNRDVGEYKFYVVGSDTKEIYKDILKNVKTLFDDLKIPYMIKDSIDAAELNENTIIIFCDEIIRDYGDLQVIGDFISNGGRVVLAAGLSEGSTDAYMQPFYGITEKNSRFSAQNFYFTGEIFPLQFDDMTYSTYNMSTHISIREEANVYIEEESGVPIVYTYEFDDGNIGIINGTLLRDIKCSGVLTGIICNMLDDFVYPVVGVKMVYLDNLPVFSVLDDVTCIDMYGRNSESFIREVIWPTFTGFSLRTETPLTISLISQASSDEFFAEINTSLMATLTKEAMQYGGELAYASYCLEKDEIFNNEELISDYKEIFPRYDVSSLVIMGEEYSEENKAIIKTDIVAIRGRLDSDNPELRFYSDGKYEHTMPGATYGNHIIDENTFEIASVLAAYGYIAHTFDMSMLMSEDQSTPTWDERKKDISVFEEYILAEATYLTGSTLYDTRNEINSYTSIEYSWTINDNVLYIDADSFISNQPFYYKTNKKIVSAKGAAYEAIGNGYYMIRLIDTKAEIYLEDNR